MLRRKKTVEILPPDPENNALRDIPVYIDTRNLIPGMVVYTVVPIEPTPKVPYAVYRIEPRIITQIHDSGINGGTIFITYRHYVCNTVGADKQIQIKSEEYTLYSPLTKEHAEYVAKMLNKQSKALYAKCSTKKQRSK